MVLLDAFAEAEQVRFEPNRLRGFGLDVGAVTRTERSRRTVETSFTIQAMAGSLAAKKRAPEGAGTLPTHTPLFVTMLIGVVVIVGALTFVPALALGPVVEHLQMTAAAVSH